jgi:tetratricopeptide (TPR) repeat protein
MSSAEPKPTPPPRKSWSSRLTILATLAIVLGPLTISSFIPGEMARWQAAAAQEATWSEDHATAVARLSRAIEWQPDNVDWWLLRGEAHLAAGDRTQASADCQHAATLETANFKTIMRHSTLALDLGLFDEAIALSRKALAAAKRHGFKAFVMAQNGLAYTLAVADRDLEEAATLIDEALKEVPEDPSLLDTRSFVNFRRGKHQLALDDANKAVANWQKVAAKNGVAANSLIADARQLKQARQRDQKVNAVLVYHRSLALEKLGQELEAAIDRDRVRQLGFKPNPELF